MAFRLKLLKKNIYIILGSLTFILGAIGIFVPLLPTTPFWLLTCWFYARSSQKLYDRFMSNKHVGKYLNNYLTEKSIPLRVKITILIILWGGTALSAWLTKNLCVAIILLVLNIAVTIHILSFRTKRKRERDKR